MHSSSSNNMDTEPNNSNAPNRSEDQIVSMSFSDSTDTFCDPSDIDTFSDPSESTPPRVPSGKLPGRSRSFDRRGAALLADMLKSAMTVAAQVSPESTLKGGGTGRAHDRSRSTRGTSPSAPSPSKRCRSVSESNEAQVVSFEAEDQFEEDPDFAPKRRALPSLKTLIDTDAAEDELEQV
jgi:hypothetical protein